MRQKNRSSVRLITKIGFLLITALIVFNPVSASTSSCDFSGYIGYDRISEAECRLVFSEQRFIARVTMNFKGREWLLQFPLATGNSSHIKFMAFDTRKKKAYKIKASVTNSNHAIELRSGRFAKYKTSFRGRVKWNPEATVYYKGRAMVEYGDLRFEKAEALVYRDENTGWVLKVSGSQPGMKLFIRITFSKKIPSENLLGPKSAEMHVSNKDLKVSTLLCREGTVSFTHDKKDQFDGTLFLRVVPPGEKETGLRSELQLTMINPHL